MLTIVDKICEPKLIEGDELRPIIKFEKLVDVLCRRSNKADDKQIVEVPNIVRVKLELEIEHKEGISSEIGVQFVEIRHIAEPNLVLDPNVIQDKKIGRVLIEVKLLKQLKRLIILIFILIILMHFLIV